MKDWMNKRDVKERNDDMKEKIRRKMMINK
jgi:hypothetical protein